MTPMKTLRHTESARPFGVVTISECTFAPKRIEPVVRHRCIAGVDRYFRPDGSEIKRAPILRRGKLLYTNANLIPKTGRIRSAELIGGISGDFPANIAAGDGGLATGTDVPIPPLDTATALEHEVARVQIQQRLLSEVTPTITYVGLFQSAGSYQFAQPGSARISEVALLCQDDNLNAIHTFAPIPVDVHRIGVLVEWEWAIV